MLHTHYATKRDSRGAGTFSAVDSTVIMYLKTKQKKKNCMGEQKVTRHTPAMLDA